MGNQQDGDEVSKVHNMEASDAEVLEAIEKVEKTRRWIADNYSKLGAKYQGKVFAVKDETVIESSDNVEHLLEEVNKKGEDTALLVVESIPRKGVAYIL
jgi:hypothetical protein